MQHQHPPPYLVYPLPDAHVLDHHIRVHSFLVNQVESAQAEREHLQAQLATQAAVFNELDVAKAETLLLRKQLTDRDASIVELQTQLTEQDARFKALTVAHSTASAKLVSDLEASREQCHSAEAVAKDARCEVTALKQQLAHNNAVQRKHDKVLASVRRTHAEERDKIRAELSAALNRLDQQAEAHAKELAAASAELQAVRQAHDSVVTIHDQCKINLDSVQKLAQLRFEKEQKKVAEGNLALVKVSEELRRAKSAMAQATKSNVTMQHRHTEMQEQLLHSQSKVDAMCGRMTDIVVLVQENTMRCERKCNMLERRLKVATKHATSSTEEEGEEENPVASMQDQLEANREAHTTQYAVFYRCALVVFELFLKHAELSDAERSQLQDSITTMQVNMLGCISGTNFNASPVGRAFMRFKAISSPSIEAAADV